MSDRERWATTQEQIDRVQAARTTGGRIGPDTIRRYKEAASKPPLAVFAGLVRGLGVSMEELLYGEEEAARIAEERASVSRGPG